MKRVFLVVLVSLVLGSVVNGQTEKTNQTDSKGLKQGRWEEKIPAGVMRGEYVNDMKEGNWISYGANDKLSKIESYSKGKREGIFVEIDQRGYLVTEYYYKNDLLEGVAKKFYYGTNPASVIDYKQGKINGTKKVYYENAIGKLSEESEYTDDVKNGFSKFYSAKGELIAEYFYKNGSLEGIVKTYYPGNKLMSEQNYVNNIESGVYKEYFEDGKVKIEGNYKNGKMEGRWMEYYETGILKSDGTYLEGEKDGKWNEFDETGKAISEARYSKGVKK